MSRYTSFVVNFVLFLVGVSVGFAVAGAYAFNYAALGLSIVAMLIGNTILLMLIIFRESDRQ